MPKLIVDTFVQAEAEAAIDYLRSRGANEEKVQQLGAALQFATYVIGKNPWRGRAIEDMPRHYRQIRTKDFQYIFSFRYNEKKDTVLIYLLRHAAQRPYSAATHRRRAAEAAKRMDE